MIEVGARLSQLLGLPKSTGQVYGLLYLSLGAMSLDDMVEQLGISKASASLATRQLASWGAIRQVWVPGERRDYYEVIADFSEFIRGGYNELIRPRLASSKRRLDGMRTSLEEERNQGIMTDAEYDVILQRIDGLQRVHNKVQSILPLAEKFL
jgi:HTH-type transcriptional regulator, glycine betaine synthesis regulator